MTVEPNPEPGLPGNWLIRDDNGWLVVCLTGTREEADAVAATLHDLRDMT